MRKKRIDAAKAIRLIALEKGLTVREVRREMSLAILAGLENQDPGMQARWKDLSHQGEAPTPEKLIAYLVAEMETEQASQDAVPGRDSR